jgi:hypothetical protein
MLCCIGFWCYIIHAMLTGVGGNAEVEWGHAVYGCRNGCMGVCVSHCMGVGLYVAGEWV